MRIGGWLLASLLLCPTIGTAGDHAQADTAIAPRDIVISATQRNGVSLARQAIPTHDLDTGGVTAAVAQSRIIYLNKNGVTLLPGNNDSRTNRSSIVEQQVAIPAWNASATLWADTVSCMRELFAPFDVTITDTNPGNVPHIEAVFGGSPQTVGLPSNVAGVSPFTTDCRVIENSIVFTFTAVIQQNARTACEIMAQEVAHSYGLDHELLASDPMTYLNYNGNRSFKNQTASCGESQARPCGINGSTCRQNQNSFALLTERLGAKIVDMTPPSIGITAPQNNATVPPGFEVSAGATDNVNVTAANLLIDDALVDTIMGPGPYTFATPETLSEGTHKITIEVTDGINTQSQDVNVTVDDGVGGGGDPGGGDPGGGDPGGGDTPGPGGDDGDGSDDGNGNADTDSTATGGTDEIVGGCATGSSNSGAALIGLALLAIGSLTRRRRS
ncbi:MAG: Ig-like domain-containing protein [Kofleriaceae bacterium]